MSDILEQYADLESHHIEGMAHADAQRRHFDVPLISEIVPGLWQGGCRHGVKLPDDFDLVISLYPWEQYQLGPDTNRVEIKAYDSSDIPDVSEAVALAHEAWAVEGQKVLIHCQAGLNRSGFVAAQVLMLEGGTAEEAIQRLRDSRSPVVLCNQAFENHLLEMGKA